MQYDAFQKKAMEAIDRQKSVLVAAPTGAGKTVIAEYAIEKSLRQNERVVYTAPIKALSNQKYRDFSQRFPERVGILTGDVSINPQASLLIMTTEIYRNQLFENPERLARTAWVIFDEVHYLDDGERGTVWEEAIMFSPDHMRFIALSATAPNIQEFASWIRLSLNHPIEEICENHRPVPLVHHFQCQSRIYEDLPALKKDGYLGHDRWSAQRFFSGRSRRRRRFSHHSSQKMLRAKPNRTEELIAHLLSQKRLPCLYFAFGRKRAEELAWHHKVFNFMSPEERTAVLEQYDRLCERFELTKESSAQDMRKLIAHGIAFHHAGMLPTLKEAIERLFTAKQIKLIFTTETFALGINMPAKTVVFDEMRKFYGTHFAFLRTRDFYQMAGRAGRRGMDSVGYVYARVNPHQVPCSVIQRIIYGKPEPIESQFNSCYATLLNLYAKFGSKLLETYPRSLHHFQASKGGRRRGLDAIERKLALLKALGYLAGENLTTKGQFASWMYGYELILSEMLAAGFLDTLDSAQLPVLLSALVFEPRKNQLQDALPRHLGSIEKRTRAFAKHIHTQEHCYKVQPYTKLPHFHLTQAMNAWCQGALFADLERFTDTDEGEIIRYFRMVVQLLRQLRQAPHVRPSLRENAGKALQNVNRDVVDAEWQLRNL